MKNLLIIALGLVFSASMAMAFDIKAGLGAAADIAGGKSAKDVAMDQAKKELGVEDEKEDDKADETKKETKSSTKSSTKKSSK